MAPYHEPGENPTLALERDLELIVRLDELGFDEAWVGEHHSTGWETIASPEIFLAVAAERTRHIRLGTGVVSLPYHHPLMVADRIVQLDHLTRGRINFGVGPGGHLTDARMLGIDPDPPAADDGRGARRGRAPAHRSHPADRGRELVHAARRRAPAAALPAPPSPDRRDEHGVAGRDGARGAPRGGGPLPHRGPRSARPDRPGRPLAPGRGVGAGERAHREPGGLAPGGARAPGRDPPGGPRRRPRRGGAASCSTTWRASPAGPARCPGPPEAIIDQMVEAGQLGGGDAGRRDRGHRGAPGALGGLRVPAR